MYLSTYWQWKLANESATISTVIVKCSTTSHYSDWLYFLRHAIKVRIPQQYVLGRLFATDRFTSYYPDPAPYLKFPSHLGVFFLLQNFTLFFPVSASPWKSRYSVCLLPSPVEFRILLLPWYICAPGIPIFDSYLWANVLFSKSIMA